MDERKEPPHSFEAEQAVIGSILLSPTCYTEAEFLLPEDFFRLDHRHLWTLIRSGPEMRDPVAMMTATVDLDTKVYISEIARNTPSAANVRMYATIVKERAMLRRVMRECLEVIGSINNDAKAADVVSGALRRFELIGEGAVVGEGPRHIHDLATEWFAEYSERVNGSGVVGLSTGFADLDARWGGLRGGQVIVLAGRPKTGKSTLALNIAEHIARTHPVAVFQMEMSAFEMVDRTLASTGQISISALRNGQRDDEHANDLLYTALANAKSLNLYVDATPRQTIDYIRMHSKAFVRKYGKGAIVIDYLGLIRSEGNARSKNDEVSEISRDIKLLAKETDCPVILLCQMNRNVEKEKRKPQLSDLRDSGSIEQDADIIAFTHKDDPEQDYSEIVTRAMRSGQPGTDYLICRFGESRFATPHEGWFPPEPDKPKRSSPRFGAGRGGKKTDEWTT